MANREKGEIPVVIAGISYTLVMNHAAMIAAEDAVSTPDREVTWDEFVARVARGSAKAFRVFIWAMFQKYHRELSLDQVGELIDAAGGADGLKAVMEAGAKASTPAKADVQAMGARPRKARPNDGTGENSTSPADVLA